MKNTFILCIFFFCLNSTAQHTISGTFSPAKDFSWLIAYHVKSDSQAYTADTAIADGEFVLKMPENAPAGTYRLVYAVPQDEFYFDVLFNGKEDIKLSFNIDQGANFTTSKENILISTYFKETQEIEQRLFDFYTNGTQDKAIFKKITKNWMALQHSYEERSVNLMANQFIRANKPYIPQRYESVQDYVKNRKQNYFRSLDFKNPTLQASGFLSDKLTNYVFTALPPEQMEKAATEEVMQGNIDDVYNKLIEVSDEYAFSIIYTLWQQTSGSEFHETANYIYNSYLKPSPVAAKNQEAINQIETHNRLRIGAIAPEISWKKDDGLEKLSTLNTAEYYLLIFWSSTCGHCLNELPSLHKELKKQSNLKVVAIGLEDDDSSWKIESAKLSDFEHAIALGKWESEYAKLYDIHSTPTYFLLDKDKRIVAKPENDKAVIALLRGNP